MNNFGKRGEMGEKIQFRSNRKIREPAIGDTRTGSKSADETEKAPDWDCREDWWRAVYILYFSGAYRLVSDEADRRQGGRMNEARWQFRRR